MNKTLSWKIVLIILLVVVAAWTLVPPKRTLKLGIDLGGGTSLIYEIDTQGLAPEERQGLSRRMIEVLRRRIDPASMQNTVWRPQGNTRFEIQMPLASADAREKRQRYEAALTTLLADNLNPATVMRSLARPAEERQRDFEKFIQDSNERADVLNELAAAYDERKSLQQQRDDLTAKKTMPESMIKLAGFDLESIQLKVTDWMKLDDAKLKEALLDFLGSENNLDLLTRYTKMYGEWAQVVNKLTDPETGANVRFNKARQALDKINISEEQMKFVLELDPRSQVRVDAIAALEAQYPLRKERIAQVVAAYDEYRPEMGRLDDPADVQRMLKGAGILEFRILPTIDHPDVDMTQMTGYVETLKTKGPKYASDNRYVWCEIENVEEFGVADAIVGQFGNEYYVLASNRKDEAMLHTGAERDWKLVRAAPGRDQYQRLSIDFSLDPAGGAIFATLTDKNIDRPLCILLDGKAISAPDIRSRIYTHGQITGRFTRTQVDDMVNKLNAGSLPARLVEQPVSVRTIGPSIGADNLSKGLKSGFIGLAGVVLAMAAYYTLGGMIADAALLMNLLFTLAIMAMMNATFTLPGIAGAILTIGMSVDANVLIFERIREEQQRGSSLSIAIKNGYQRAFSAIFDSNLTTILTALILYTVASEEIKGFAIVLMLGLASSMFTALFVTRVAFDWLVQKRIIKDHLVMLHLIRKPNINWMNYRPAFFLFSAIITIGGLVVFFTRDQETNNKYDIEFTGGTSVQIDLKDDVALTRQQVEDMVRQAGETLKSPGLAAASVYSVGKTGRQYEINTSETNKTLSTIILPPGHGQTPQNILAAIETAALEKDAHLSQLAVVPVEGNPNEFGVRTSQLNTMLVAEVIKTAMPAATVSNVHVDEVVTTAILGAFEGQLKIQQDLEPNIVSDEKVTETVTSSYPELADYLGGVLIRCNLARPATGAELDQRFRTLRMKPDFVRSLAWYPYMLVGSDLEPIDPNSQVGSFAYIGVDEEAAFRDLSEEEWTQFVENERAKVLAATELETSLPQVTQIDPSIGAEAKTRALIAIVLSLIAMLAYIWLRFGDLRFGVGAVATLAHDTCATLGAVTGCTYIAATAIGQLLLIGDFKIDMTMIAAFLTLLGYSINDTIVIYDRIRENRRKGTQLTPQIITNSVNETLSRTLLTGITTLLVVLVMYIFGAKGLRGFNFALLFGILIGTYSSIGISAPILLLGTKLQQTRKPKAASA